MAKMNIIAYVTILRAIVFQIYIHTLLFVKIQLHNEKSNLPSPESGFELANWCFSCAVIWLLILVDIVRGLFDRNMNSVQIVYPRHLITDLSLVVRGSGLNKRLSKTIGDGQSAKQSPSLKGTFALFLQCLLSHRIQNKQFWEWARGTLLSRCLSYLICQRFSIYISRLICKTF